LRFVPFRDAESGGHRQQMETMRKSMPKLARQSAWRLAPERNLKIIFALKTLNENGVEIEKWPSRPA
jgi:hypothetical protein